jgi:hypothetical protein
MANKQVKKIALATSDIPGLKSSRYERLQVSYGAIATSQYGWGDTLTFADIPSRDIIRASVVAHSANPATLEVYPASDKADPFTLQVPGSTLAPLSYIIEYVRGVGKVNAPSDAYAGTAEGEKFAVTISSAALATLTTSQVAALTTEDLVGLATSQLTELDALEKEVQLGPLDA